MITIYLQKPQILPGKFRQVIPIKMGEDFGHHFGVNGGDRKVLLTDAFPIHTAELIYLVYQLAHHTHCQFLWL